MSDWVVLEGDCVERMREMDEASIDAIVCDPPYGLEFMGKQWDALGRFDARDKTAKSASMNRDNAPIGTSPSYVGGNAAQEWHQAWATEALRVLKPGGHLLAFGGTRTYHRLACAVEDAGFEIRDSLIWLYGSGFPKSLNVGKAIDRANGRKFEDRYELGRHIRAQREAAGLTQAEVNEWFDYRDGCQHWERQDPSGARVPTLDDWQILAERLELSDEFLPLVERAEAEREVVGRVERGPHHPGGAALQMSALGMPGAQDVTAPATPEAQKWNGWGTALKPGHEPIVVARKPLIGTVAANVQKYCVGVINIDGCRVEGEPEAPGTTPATAMDERTHGAWTRAEYEVPRGRWPANVALSHLPECESDPVIHWTEEGRNVVEQWDCAPGCPIAELDEQSGERPVSGSAQAGKAISGGHRGIFGGAEKPDQMGHNDSGGASRFFYQAKASRGERNAGLDGFEAEVVHDGRQTPIDNPYLRAETERQNTHPTVKPIDLMRWLVRLVTPPGGTVLDPFAGSGTTGVAAVLEGFDFIGIEREAEYVEIARARIEWWEPHAGRDTEDVLVEAGFSERLQEEYRAAGQMGLLDG